MALLQKKEKEKEPFLLSVPKPCMLSLLFPSLNSTIYMENSQPMFSFHPCGFSWSAVSPPNNRC